MQSFYFFLFFCFCFVVLARTVINWIILLGFKNVFGYIKTSSVFFLYVDANLTFVIIIQTEELAYFIEIRAFVYISPWFYLRIKICELSLRKNTLIVSNLVENLNRRLNHDYEYTRLNHAFEENKAKLLNENKSLVWICIEMRVFNCLSLSGACVNTNYCDVTISVNWCFIN